MPTEVTNQSKQIFTDTSQVQEKKVIAPDRTVARQGLSGNEQTLPPAKESSQSTNQQLEEATDSINQHVQSLQRDLHFSVDEDTGETLIRVVETTSQKTIRTIPSEEFLSIQQQFNQSVGLLFNAEA